MAASSVCLGHEERVSRRNKTLKLLQGSPQALDEEKRILIKKGPVSAKTSLREIEIHYKSRPEWRVVEEGGVLSIPVEEFRMVKPSPKWTQAVQETKKQGLLEKVGKIFSKAPRNKPSMRDIEHYPVGVTSEKLMEQSLGTYQEFKESAKKAGKSNNEAEKIAGTQASKEPHFQAVKGWLDIKAEITMKRALEKMMNKLKIPALIIRSIDLKSISPLKDLGLKISGDAEIDILMCYISGNFLHLVICEVKRCDTNPWQTESKPPNKQAVHKAENQLTRDVSLLMAILAGCPPECIHINSLACYPDSSSEDLQKVTCPDCMKTNVVCQEDVEDLALLQNKTSVPSEPHPATVSGKQLLLTLSARLLSHHSLLHVGYRELQDKEDLTTKRHNYNLQEIDGKLMMKEFVIASPEQMQALSRFNTTSYERNLLLEGPAGTGKTLVALGVANSLIEALSSTCTEGNEPVLVVTAGFNPLSKDCPIMKHLNSSTTTAGTKIFMDWQELVREYLQRGIFSQSEDLPLLASAIANIWQGREIVFVVDELIDRIGSKRSWCQMKIHENVRLILVLNPSSYEHGTITLPRSFLQITLATPYRSTLSITSLTRFMAKRLNLKHPEKELGTDVEGFLPIFFDVGRVDNEGGKLWRLCEAFDVCERKSVGKEVTVLWSPPESNQNLITNLCKSRSGGSWQSYYAVDYYGSESEGSTIVIHHDPSAKSC